MNRKEALEEFKINILPCVIQKYGENDVTAIREAWNNWTDSLYKSHQITHKQYETWLGPF
jgi:hypothetical protein